MGFVEISLGGLISVLSICFFVRFFFLGLTPSFLQMDKLEEDELLLRVKELAIDSSRYKIKRRGFISTKQIRKRLKKAFCLIEEKVQEGQSLFECERWLYDNYYKIEERALILKSQKQLFNGLPFSNGHLRIYRLCELLIKSTNAQIDLSTIKKAVEEFNSQSPLLYNEFTVFSSMLEFVLLEHIAILSGKIKETAELIKKAKQDAKAKKVNKRLVSDNAYMANLYQESQDQEKSMIAQMAIQNALCIERRIFYFLEEIGYLDKKTSLAFEKLYRLKTELKIEKIISLSKVYSFLENEEGILFSSLTFSTKQLYLSHIAKISKKEKSEELQVAREAATKAKKENKDISFFILPPFKPRSLQRFLIFVFLFIPILPIPIIAIFLGNFSILISLLFLPISFYLFQTFFRNILNKAVKRRSMPKKSISSQNGEGCRAVIVVPTLITNMKDIHDSFCHIKTIIELNYDSFFSYSLLFDFVDAKKIEEEGDIKLLEEIENQYNKNNLSDRLSVFVRKRVLINKGKNFGGYEKKRGALLDFNEAVLTRNADKFRKTFGAVPNAEYAVCLDSDSIIQNAKALIQTLEHPYNKEKVIAAVGSSSVVPAENASIFEKLFAGSVGINRYQEPSQNINFNLFGCGNFTGKGAYRIREFQEKICGSFQDERILCHDFLEGASAKTVETGIVVLENFPQNFSSFFLRELRWQRGDWQLFPYLFRRKKNKEGKKVKNNIEPIDKYNILFNIARPLSTIFSLLLLFLAPFSSFSLVVILLSLSPYILPIFLYPHPKEAVRQIFLFSVLPIIALQTLFAFLLTIARLITKKNLLVWKTFRHQKQRVMLYPQVFIAIGLALLNFFFLRSIFLYIIAGVFVLGIFVELWFSKAKKEEKVKGKDRDFLFSVLKSTYKYFQQAPKYNFLPPDNIQDSSFTITERTSPTNIGFAIISHICAFFASIITKQQMQENCKNIISTVEKMEKWHGNLYNWYDIKTLCVLPPRFVSSVDSGNFLASLLLLFSVSSGELKERVEVLIKETKIEKLYNKEKKLFYIGYNASLLEFDTACYDLLASEALCTYLFSIATKKIERASFYNLSTTGYKYGLCKVLASWTGGAFEYLMPSLFFNFNKYTLIGKSAACSVKAQIKYAKKERLSVFGISESQYNLKDKQGYYQYKAHGIPQIALSNAECVKTVTPHAGVLSLQFARKKAIKNLYLLKQKNMLGEMGFFEAVCLKQNKIIKTVMAHHQGMIIASLTNFLFNKSLIKALEELPQYRASQLLLQEEQKILFRKKKKECLAAPKLRMPVPHRCEKNSPLYTNLLSLADYSLAIDNKGNTRSFVKNICVERPFSKELKIILDNKQFNLLSGASTHSHINSSFELLEKSFTAVTAVSILPFGEVRRVSVINKTNKPIKLQLVSKTEPVLQDYSANFVHRAYADMFLKNSFNSDEKFVIVERKLEKPLYLTHFTTEKNCVVNTSRQSYYQRGSEELGVNEEETEPVISLHIPILLSANSKKTIYIYTLTGFNKEELINRVASAKKNQTAFLSTHNPPEGLLAENYISDKAKRLYTTLTNNPQIDTEDDSFTALEKPLVSFFVHSEKSFPYLKAFLQAIKPLYKFGAVFSVYIVYKEKHSYFLKIKEGIYEVLDELNFLSKLSTGSEVILINEYDQKEKAQEVRKCSLWAKS